MNLDDIPQGQTVGFQTGVSEQVYDTEAEMAAFLAGISYVGDLDVCWGKPFLRGGKYVIRVRVGEWGDE